MRISRAVASFLAAPLILSIAAAPLARAKEFDRLIPEDAMLVLGLKSVSGMKQWLAASPFAKVWESKEMEPFRKELETLQAKMSPAGKEGAREVEALLDLVGGEVALVLGNLARVDPQAVNKGAEFPVALLAGCPGKKAEVAEAIKKLVQKGVDDGGLRRGDVTDFRGFSILELFLPGSKEEGADSGPKKLFVAHGEEIAAAGLDKRLLQDMIANFAESQGKTLRDNPRYRATLEAHGPAVAALAYVNLDGIGAFIQRVASMQGEESGMSLQIAGKVTDMLGVSTLQGVSISLSLEASAIGTALQVLTGPEPKGLVKMLATKPQALRFPPVIPDDVASCSVTQVDFGALYGVIQAAAKFAGSMASGGEEPEGGGIDMLQQYEQMLGIKIQDDLLGPLSGQVVDFTRLRKPFTDSSQEMALLLELKDKDRFQATIDKLFAMLPFFKKTSYLDGVLYVMGEGGAGGGDESAVALAIAASQLVLGVPGEAAREVIRRQGKEVKSVTDTEAYKAVASYLPPTATMIAFANADSLEYLVHLLRNAADNEMLQDVAGSGDGAGNGAGEVQPEDIIKLCKKLPEPAFLVKPIIGSVSQGQVDGRGIVWSSRLLLRKKE